MESVKTIATSREFLQSQPILRLRTGSLSAPRFQLIVLLLAAGLLFLQNRAVAQLTIVHSFGDGSVTNDGAYPAAGLIQAPNGEFFGVTNAQAKQPKTIAGTIFHMTPAGKVGIIYRFGLTSGIDSDQPLLYYQGKLIGVTGYGSSSTEKGSLFELRKAPSTGVWRLSYWQKNLYADGSPILGSDGNFYGVGAVGTGINGVYVINPTTHQIVTEYSFADTSNYYLGPGLVEGKDGNFYGSTTLLAGFVYQWGAIFQLTPSGQITFSQAQVALATGPMIQASNGTFYGLSATFSEDLEPIPGFVFSYTPSGGVAFDHEFGQGSDGTFPVGTVVQGPNGDLYGVTQLGGTAGQGILFEVSTLGVYTILHNFGDGSVPNDGGGPEGTLIVGKDNNLYGTTVGGGTAGLGTIFKFSP